MVRLLGGQAGRSLSLNQVMPWDSPARTLPCTRHSLSPPSDLRFLPMASESALLLKDFSTVPAF